MKILVVLLLSLVIGVVLAKQVTFDEQQHYYHQVSADAYRPFICDSICEAQKKEYDLKRQLFIQKHNLDLLNTHVEQQNEVIHQLQVRKTKVDKNDKLLSDTNQKIDVQQAAISSVEKQIGQIKQSITDLNNQLTDEQHTVLTVRQATIQELQSEIDAALKQIDGYKSVDLVDKTVLNTLKQGLQKKRRLLLEQQNKVLEGHTLRVIAHLIHHRQELKSKLANLQTKEKTIAGKLNKKSTDVTGSFEQQYYTKKNQEVTASIASLKQMITKVDDLINGHVKSALTELQIPETDSELQQLRALINDDSISFYSIVLKKSDNAVPQRYLCSLNPKAKTSSQFSGLDIHVSQLFDKLTCFNLHSLRINSEYRKNAPYVTVATHAAHFSQVTIQLSLSESKQFQLKTDAQAKIQNGKVAYISYFVTAHIGTEKVIEQVRPTADKLVVPDEVRTYLKDHPLTAKHALKAYLMQKLNLPSTSFSAIITTSGFSNPKSFSISTNTGTTTVDEEDTTSQQQTVVTTDNKKTTIDQVDAIPENEVQRANNDNQQQQNQAVDIEVATNNGDENIQENEDEKIDEGETDFVLNI
jgi:hypothetical protein